MKNRYVCYLKSLLGRKGIISYSFFSLMFFCLAINVGTASANSYSGTVTAEPHYGELQVENFGKSDEHSCLSELKKADILTKEMVFLGTRQSQFNEYTLWGVTVVSESPNGDQYFVLSCRVNNDASGMVAGPLEIQITQAYYTRADIALARQ